MFKVTFWWFAKWISSIDKFISCADTSPFNLYYSRENVLHLRTWISVLERGCFSSISLTKELGDKIYKYLITCELILLVIIWCRLFLSCYNIEYKLRKNLKKNLKVNIW